MKQKLLFCFLSLFIFYTGMCQIAPGEVLWLSADKNVVMDANNRVSEWPDRSSYGHSVFQLDSLYKPKWVKDVFGHKPAIFFDGVNGKYFMSNNLSNLTTAGSPRTVFIMGLVDSAATDNGGGDFPSAGGTMFTFRRSGHIFAVQAARVNHSIAPKADYIYTGGTGTLSNAIAANKQYYSKSKKCSFIDVFISSGAGTYLRVRQNGDSVPVTQTSPITSDDGVTGFTVGDRQDFNGQDWQGYIAEIIVYDRELSSSEIVQTEAYLSSKYPRCFSLLPNDKSYLTISNPIKLNFAIYPNPVNNSLIIDGLPQAAKIRLKIIDMTARIIATAEISNSSKYVWDISRLKSGNYILSVENNGNVVNKIFMKEQFRRIIQ